MKRVVVTGLGIVSPIGITIGNFWDELLQGKSGVRPVTKVSGFPENSKAAEVLNFEKDKRYDIYSDAVGYLYEAIREAIQVSGLGDYRKDVGLIVGTTNGNHDLVDKLVDKYTIDVSKPVDYPDGFVNEFSKVKLHELSSRVAADFGFEGINMVIPTACAAGNYAIGTAYSFIKHSNSDIMFVGGADPFVQSCFNIFFQLGAMSYSKCSPFVKDREGMIVGEGAGILVLEELEHALKRNAPIFAEVKGYGLSCDAYHPVAPDPEGKGAIRAMKSALSKARLEADDISYISAHATGTPSNDSHEYTAMYEVFKEKLSDIPVCGIKSMLGHCMGAASIFEAIASVLSIKDQVLPPTINVTEIDPEFEYLNVHNVSKPMKIENVMSNAFGFGGNISSVIFSKYS